MKYNNSIKLGTTFSGIGAIEQALKNLSIPHEVVWACDIDQKVKETYLANHTCKNWYDDIETIDVNKLEYVDLYVFGSPCQDVSFGGKKDLSLGRSILVEYSLDIVDKTKPKYIIFENVKGILSAKFKYFFEFITSKLSENYNIKWKVLNSKDFGVPQNRERLFLVGIRKDIIQEFDFPVGTETKLRILDIKDNSATGFIAETHKFSHMPYKLNKNYRQYNRMGKGHNSQNDRVYREDGICCTLPAKGGGSPYVAFAEGIRKLNTLERLRLQGFPDDFIFPHKRGQIAYSQLGNSITVNVLEEIIKNLL